MIGIIAFNLRSLSSSPGFLGTAEYPGVWCCTDVLGFLQANTWSYLTSRLLHFTTTWTERTVNTFFSDTEDTFGPLSVLQFTFMLWAIFFPALIQHQRTLGSYFRMAGSPCYMKILLRCLLTLYIPSLRCQNMSGINNNFPLINLSQEDFLIPKKKKYTWTPDFKYFPKFRTERNLKKCEGSQWGTVWMNKQDQNNWDISLKQMG